MSVPKTTIEIEGKVLPLRLYSDGKMQPIKINGEIVGIIPERKIQQWALDNAKYLRHITVATIPAFTFTERELTSEELEDLENLEDIEVKEKQIPKTNRMDAESKEKPEDVGTASI